MKCPEKCVMMKVRTLIMSIDNCMNYTLTPMTELKMKHIISGGRRLSMIVVVLIMWWLQTVLAAIYSIFHRDELWLFDSLQCLKRRAPLTSSQIFINSIYNNKQYVYCCLFRYHRKYDGRSGTIGNLKVYCCLLLTISIYNVGQYILIAPRG